MIAASAVGCIFAFQMNAFAQSVFAETSDDYYFALLSQPRPSQWAAPVLGVVAALMTLTFLGGVLWKRLPGVYSTMVAADWANVSDAIARMVDAGSNYSEAFRAAAAISKTSAPKQWLIQRAKKIETGYSGPLSQVSAKERVHGDAAILSVLVDHSGDQPQNGWRAAEQHFDNVSRQRFELTRTMLPILATLVAGLMLWLSVACTLGWVWSQMKNLIDALTW